MPAGPHENKSWLVDLFAVACTGFVHTFPDASFSRPRSAMPGGDALRSALRLVCDRALGAFFTALAAALILGKTGRSHRHALVQAGRPGGRHGAPARHPGPAPGAAAAQALEPYGAGRVSPCPGLRGDDHLGLMRVYAGATLGGGTPVRLAEADPAGVDLGARPTGLRPVPGPFFDPPAAPGRAGFRVGPGRGRPPDAEGPRRLQGLQDSGQRRSGV